MKALLLRSGKPYLKLAKKNRKVKGLFTKFGFLVYLGVVSMLILAYLSPYVPPDRFLANRISWFGIPNTVLRQWCIFDNLGAAKI